MIPKKEFDFQIAVERPVGGVYGDRQDQIFPKKNQYMNFSLDDALKIVETGATVYNSTQAQQAAAANAAAAQANLQAQQAALLAAQNSGATVVGGVVVPNSSGTPKWIPWTIGGVLLVAGVVVTIVLVKK